MAPVQRDYSKNGTEWHAVQREYYKNGTEWHYPHVGINGEGMGWGYEAVLAGGGLAAANRERGGIPLPNSVLIAR